MPGTVTLIMRHPKRAGNLPSDFFTLEREAGAKFPSKKVSLAGAGTGSRYTRKKLHSRFHGPGFCPHPRLTQKTSHSIIFFPGLYPRCEKEYDKHTETEKTGFLRRT